MAGFFVVWVLSFVVVICAVATGWMRRHATSQMDDSNKKRDIEENALQVVIDDQKISSNNHPKHDTHTDNQPALNSVLESKLPLDLTNRRQYVRAVCDRFESWASGTPHEINEGQDKEEALENNVPMHCGRGISSFNPTASAYRTNPKSHNLSSFVRQCVSNIERTAFTSSNYRTRPQLIPRDSTTSNQHDSPPKPTVVKTERLPSLVIATDCGPKEIKQDGGDEFRSIRQPLLLRTPSARASPLRRTASDVPPLAPFAAIALKAVSSQALPPVWSRNSRAEMSTSKRIYVDPEELESPALFEDHTDVPPFTPTPPRKGSSAAARLLQFQQLVPSNQARASFTTR